MNQVHVPYRYPRFEVDATHPRFIADHNRCVLCSRCVRVCDEIEGAHTWDVMGRGVEARVITDLNQPWGESESCTGCGKCVHVCPTGALVEKGGVGRGDDQAARVPALPDPDAGGARMSRPTLATVWLDGCSGCHMSFLDLDERLLELADPGGPGL